jgi:CIC family chloride channel protein
MFADPMLEGFFVAGARIRSLTTRLLTRWGFKDDSYLLILAVFIGVATAIAAVGFHQLISIIRDKLYLLPGEQTLYHSGLILLVIYPALGGFIVGIVSQFVFRMREGHGIVDVVESVVRTSGFQSPLAALEKIITAGVTIGTGGSAGAEGPIVQIGAGIASGIGQIFRVARHHMPVLIGCGSAAGISAIFNAPFGGVLFTLEVILQDFSIRAFTPVIVASVIAQVTELLLFQMLSQSGSFHPIFNVSPDTVLMHNALHWAQVGNFVLLGVICGVVGLTLTRAMYGFERLFDSIKLAHWLKPTLGGAIVGLLGIAYVLIFGRFLLHVPKPVPFDIYPMPAFFGDGYGFIERLLAPDYYQSVEAKVLLLLGCLCLIKIIATCLTLSSGGSGGVIAPSLFLGATVGAVLGTLLRNTGWFHEVRPEVYALVGMGAALAAVVHAPLASILICFEVTEDYRVMVPAMLACIVSTGVARLIYPDSIYTLSLRRRGIRPGAGADFSLLRRLNVEMIAMEPATIFSITEPMQKVLDLTISNGISSFVIVDEKGNYAGMIGGKDITTALVERAAVPLLLAGDLMRTDIPVVKNTDDLGTVLDTFVEYDVSHLPVVVQSSPQKVIGLISRGSLMRRYQQELANVQ